MNCRGEPWLAHEIGCKIVGDSQNRPYITFFFGIFTDKSRCWRSLSAVSVYATYATLGVYVVNKIEAIALVPAADSLSLDEFLVRIG